MTFQNLVTLCNIPRNLEARSTNLLVMNVQRALLNNNCNNTRDTFLRNLLEIICFIASSIILCVPDVFPAVEIHLATFYFVYENLHFSS